MPHKNPSGRTLLALLVCLALLLPASPLLAQETPTAAQATVIRNANLRAGPGTNYAVVGKASAGELLDVVATNGAGDWFKLADGNWIFGGLLESPPDVAADGGAPAGAPQAVAPVAVTAPAAVAGQAVLVADSAADFPGGRDRNNWYYLWTEGRSNFNWQEMRQANPDECYKDTANKGLEICRDTMTAKPSGDVGLQWKASQGGDYRFEWDSASLTFYKHAELVGILEKGVELPYAATVRNVIDWELFFWVAADSTPYHVRVYRLGDAGSAAPPAAPAAAAAPTLSFGNGVKIVGSDIAAGTYRTDGGESCYWERLRGFGGTMGEIIANDFGGGPKIVTIAATDKGFRSSRCNGWTLDLSPITSSPDAPFSAGTFFVGKDVAPGLWRSSSSDYCYWERLSGFSGQLKDILANDFLAGPTVVDIRVGDTGFNSRNCGAWTKIN
jgi:hypothetical protein